MGYINFINNTDLNFISKYVLEVPITKILKLLRFLEENTNNQNIEKHIINYHVKSEKWIKAIHKQLNNLIVSLKKESSNLEENINILSENQLQNYLYQSIDKIHNMKNKTNDINITMDYPMLLNSNGLFLDLSSYLKTGSVSIKKNIMNIQIWVN